VANQFKIEKGKLMQLTLPTGAVVHIGRDVVKKIATKRSSFIERLDALKSSISKSTDLDAVRSEQAQAQAKIEEINSEANALADLLAFRAKNIKALGQYLSAIDANDAILGRVHLEPELIHAARTLKTASAYYGDSRRSIGAQLTAYAAELEGIAAAVTLSATKSTALLRVIDKKIIYQVTKNQHIKEDISQLTKLHGKNGDFKKLQEQTAELEALRKAALAGDYDSELRATELHPQVLALNESLKSFIDAYNDAQMHQKQEIFSQARYEITAYRAKAGMKEKTINLQAELDGEIYE